MSKVKDPKLAGEGKKKIAWAEDHMPVLMRIREEFRKDKPLKGLTIAACLHVTKETAVLMRTLRDGGAAVGLCGSNPLSTQDDIAAALAEDGINIFAWRGVSNDEYYWCVDQVLNLKPNITMDDGGDLVATIHSKRTDLLKNIIGGTEETTTGIIRFRSMEKDKALKYPIISVNDAYTKHLFDNRYGTGQSTIDGIMRSTSVLLAGKNFVVGGYGMCGKGIATRARGMGSNVIVTEVDPVRALEAYMDGFRVMSMSEAAKIGDIFVTASGDKDLIRKEHMEKMKSGAILANSGHFNVEINIKELESLSASKSTVKPNVEEFRLRNGKKLYLLGEGRLVNLAAAEGHPSEVMQMSFSNQALCTKYLKENKGGLENKVYNVPKEIDIRIANLTLKAAGIEIDTLSPEQKKYLESWQEGT
ncbi:MAG: adenosylhomocysteinase [Candidatus Aenigmarchaeota archaeon]|nr:adenosylhomocysteinase [Candidatus Aenigmarchaeota archaeon]